MKAQLATALAMALCLTGCAKTLTMVYHSNPEGAMVYQGDVFQGQAPITLKYAAPANFKSGGCTTLRPMTAVWSSGARAAVQNLTACRSNTYLQHFVFERPRGAPGLDADAQVAAAQQTARAIQAQADADTAEANAWMIGNALGNAASTLHQSPPPPPAYPTPTTTPSVTCTSKANNDFAKTVTTTCH